MKKKQAALENPENKILWEIIKDVNPADSTAIDKAVMILNNAGVKTPKGHTYDRIRLRSRILSMKKMRGLKYYEQQ